MKISSVQGYSLKNTAFNGITKYISYSDNKNNAKAGHPNPEPEVEKTMGAFRETPINRVYWASPLEDVSDSIKSKHDYIVYDHEPSYPRVEEEVSKRYFENDRHDYSQDFADVKNYYYRMEISDRREKSDFYVYSKDYKQREERIPVAQYQQWQAAECIGIYEEAKPLLQQKDNAFDMIDKLKQRLKNLPNEIKVNEKILTDSKIAKANAEEDLNLIKKKESLARVVESFDEKAKQSPRIRDLFGAEKKAFESNKVEDEGLMASTIALIAALQAKIEECEQKKIDLPKLYDSIPKDIKYWEAKIEGLKAKLIPHFDKLKNFYAKQGIKVIKKV